MTGHYCTGLMRGGLLLILLLLLMCMPIRCYDNPQPPATNIEPTGTTEQEVGGDSTENGTGRSNEKEGVVMQETATDGQTTESDKLTLPESNEPLAANEDNKSDQATPLSDTVETQSLSEQQVEQKQLSEQQQVLEEQDNKEMTAKDPSNETEEVDDIVTFEEFKSRASQDVPTNMQLPPQGNIPIHKGSNNFASHECGAKVVATNPEAKNAGAILTDNKDEYMLNPCSAEIWFVIELCELVSVSKFEIGSFELFSSIPESFAVFTSESFPTSNWEKVSSFQMHNERGVQEFPLADTVYAKYIKIVMLKHFGSEHYCPVSMVRVYGATMMEEYEYSETRRTLATNGEAIDGQERLTITGNEKDTDLDSSQGNNPILAATDAIFNAIGKAVNGLIGTEKRKAEESDESLLPVSQEQPINGESVESSSSECATQNGHNSSPEIMTSAIDHLSTSQHLPSMIAPPSFENNNSSSIHIPLGPTKIHQELETNSTASAIPLLTQSTIESSHTVSSSDSNVSNSSHPEMSRLSTNEQHISSGTVISPTVSPMPSIPSLPIENGVDTVDSNVTQGGNGSDSLAQPTNRSQNLTANVTVGVQFNASSQAGNVSSNHSYGEESASVNGIPREKSVFLRLSNRINYLELNMSLFGSYLDQISSSLKRSKNRTDDMQRRLSHLNSTIQLYNLQTQLNGSLVAELSASLAHLSMAVTTLQEVNFIILTLASIGILCLTCLQMAVLMCCYRIWSQSQQLLQQSITDLREELTVLREQLKKDNSRSSPRRSPNVAKRQFEDNGVMVTPVTLSDTCSVSKGNVTKSSDKADKQRDNHEWQTVNLTHKRRRSFSSKKDTKPTNHNSL